MKKIISAVIAVLTALLSLTAVFAVDLPEDYCLYSIDGLERYTVVSSLSPEYDTALDTSLILDHRTGTGLDFALDEKFFDTVSINFSFEEAFELEKIAILVEHDENTSVEVALFAADDPESNVWVPVSLEGDGKDGKWDLINVGEMSKEFKVYRLTFEIKEGETYSIKEIAFFKTPEKPAAPVVDKNAPLLEKEQWRKVGALRRGRIF